MGIKVGVRLYGVQPEMVQCDGIVRDVMRAHSVRCWRTSIVGKKHKKGSLHPVGFAEDYRTKHITGQRRMGIIEPLLEDLRDALPCCDIIFEYEGEEQEHIHVEFDPKDDPTFQQHKAIYKETGQWPQR